MQNLLYVILTFLLLVPVTTALGQSPGEACTYFFEQLNDIPHEELDQKYGEIVFSWDEKKYNGCSVRFVTNDSLLAGEHKTPSFWPKDNAYLHQNGWRYNLNYDSDGPGTSTFAIEKGDTLCLIDYAQPSTLVEHGKIVREENITITVECRQKEIK